MAAKPDKETNPISQDRCPSDGDVGTIEEFRDDAREKQVVHKVDLCLMTLFGALYLMSFLGKFVRSPITIIFLIQTQIVAILVMPTLLALAMI